MDTITARLDDPAAARESGDRKLDWAREHMPILAALRDRFEAERPLDGQRVGMAMHVEAKTGVLVELLAAGGATVAITGCNPLSTQDDVSAALDARARVDSYARHDVADDEYYGALDAVARFEPTVTVDDGCDLVTLVHDEYPDLVDSVVGGCEETTTGVHRLRAMADDGALRYPVFAVNDTPTKRLFDNVHGTGESVLANVAMTTNLVVAGKTVVVAGYGHCGRGVARKADGMDAHVVVTEVDPRKALEAHMDGHEVMPMREAAAEGDLFVTTTGNRDVVVDEHFDAMQDGAVLANAGHFDVEVDVDALDDRAVARREVRPGVEEFEMADGRRLHLLAEGRLVNLAGPLSMGHPVEVMDQSFGVQALCVRELVERSLDAGVHDVPDAVDREVARVKLAAEGVDHDDLTDRQREYMDSWQHGT
jgi:adenosylhomocysteinase